MDPGVCIIDDVVAMFKTPKDNFASDFLGSKICNGIPFF
jgi:hypothetical protein